MRFGIVLILFTLFFATSCNKNKKQAMPYAPVDEYINTSLPSYSNLNIIGGWVYINGGNDGIILYRQSYETIMAYERRCTYNAFEACGFSSVDSTGLVVVCGCDGSRYSIFDGSILQGPAINPLFQYRVSYSPDANQVHVTN